MRMQMLSVVLLAAAAACVESDDGANDTDEPTTVPVELATTDLFRAPATQVHLVTASPPGLTLARAVSTSGQPATNCQRDLRVGACRVQLDCDFTAAPSPSARPVPPVTITSGATTIALEASNGFTFFSINPPFGLVPAGAAVHATSPGEGPVRGFTLDGVMPARATPVAPALAAPDAIDVDRGQPLAMTFAGGSALVSVLLSTQEVEVITQPDGNRGFRPLHGSVVQCLALAEDGEVRIPRRVLQLLPASDSVGEEFRNTASLGARGTLNTLGLASEAHQVVASGRWRSTQLAELVLQSSNVQSTHVSLR